VRSTYFFLPQAFLPSLRQGELGLGDTKNRLRPEVIRSLKTVNCVKISAGGHHSMVISSPQGLLFAFGSNSHGQLGLGLGQESEIGSGAHINSEDRVSCLPTVIDRLRDYQVLDVACGLSHTLLVCRGRVEEGDHTPPVRVLSMGLNSSGQCGIGHYKNTAKPTQIAFPGVEIAPYLGHVSVHTGPLSYHSFVSFSAHEMKRQKLPSVDLVFLEKVVNQYNLNQQASTLISLREMIAESYSSLSVLNSSFRILHSQSSLSLPPSAALAPVGGLIDLDLDSVRRSYQLIFSTNSEQVSRSYLASYCC
jgi:hypothetical protein